MPDGPLTARGYAATACFDDGMLVWSGSQPAKGPGLEVHAGGAVYAGGSWQEMPDGPLSPRMSPGAAVSRGHVLVWGGHDGTPSSENPDASAYPSDGALFDLNDASWEILPPSPLSGRLGPTVLALGRAFLVYGGRTGRGPHPLGGPPAARYDMETESWELLAGPPEESLVVAGDTLVAFAGDGIYRYDGTGDEWVFDVPYPDGVVAPVSVASNGMRVAGGKGSAVWTYGREFEVLSETPIGDLDYVGWLGDEVVIWSSTDGAAAVYDEDSATWQRHDATPFREPRIGVSICSNGSRLYVWGGWIDRETLLLATDSGASLRRP